MFRLALAGFGGDLSQGIGLCNASWDPIPAATFRQACGTPPMMSDRGGRTEGLIAFENQGCGRGSAIGPTGGRYLRSGAGTKSLG